MTGAYSPDFLEISAISSDKVPSEEFAVILPETESEKAKVIANRIRRNVSLIDIEVAKNVHIRPSVSVGIAEFPTCADDGTTLIELADIALYQAKSGGKNIVYEYTPFGCQRVAENYGLENNDADPVSSL